MTRIIVCGKTTFDDYKLLKEKLDEITKDISEVEIVSGCARGADCLGEKYAEENKLPCMRFPANWQNFGRAAGPIRNSQMIDYICDCENKMVVAFWDRKSSGTGDTVRKAQRRNIECIIVEI